MQLRQFVPAFKVNAIDIIASGDVYCVSLAVALTEGKSLVDQHQQFSNKIGCATFLTNKGGD